MGRIRSSLKAADQHVPVYAVPADIDAVLANWGRWAGARAGRAAGAHVGVMWRQALRGNRWYTGEVSGAPTATTVDQDQAWAVERLVCGETFSPRFRELLRQHYVLQAPASLTCRLLHVQPRGYDCEIWRAANYFWAHWQRLFSRSGAEYGLKTPGAGLTA